VIGASARLLRGFATDFLTSHDVAAAKMFMDPAYRLSIGGVEFRGRDNEYLPATVAQLDQFPGLCVTVHDVVLAPEAAAMRFTEHGASIRDEGRAAAWGGVTLFRIANDVLIEGWAEEDYFARKRQLKSGVCDPVKPPHQAPWDVVCEDPQGDTELAARNWLADTTQVLQSPTVDEIRSGGPRFGELINASRVSVTTLFSAGNRAAFHIAMEGTYRGGFNDIDRGLIGTPVSLEAAGLLTIVGGVVVEAQISADRLGVHRSLVKRSRR
jgi:predicted ester cyclase